MRKTIPASVEIICDICGDKTKSYKKKAILTLESRDIYSEVNPVDYQSYDLCDFCFQKIENSFYCVSLGHDFQILKIENKHENN